MTCAECPDRGRGGPSPARSTRAVNAGGSIARRCEPRSSTPHSGRSTSTAPPRSACARSPKRPVPPSRRSTGTSPTSPTCSRRSASGCATCSGVRSSRTSTPPPTRPGRSSAVGVAEYVNLVEQHPTCCDSCCRVGSPPNRQSPRSARSTRGREITMAFADTFNNELRGMQLDPAALQLAAAAAFGACSAATDWWLGPPIRTARAGCRRTSSSIT